MCFKERDLIIKIKSLIRTIRLFLKIINKWFKTSLIEKQLENLTDQIPDPDTKDHFGVLPAMDTALALQSCLQAIIDHSIEDSEAITEVMSERLAEVIRLQADDENVELESDELWQRHQDFIAELLSLISSKKSHADLVKKLIPFSSDHGVSHLGICLEE